MNKRPFLFLMISLMFASLACGLPGLATPTPEPSPIPTITLAPAGVLSSPVPVDTATVDVPTEVVVEAETAVPTEEPPLSPTPTMTLEPAEAETAMPVAEGEVFGPGQQDSRSLAGSGEQTYLIDGVKFTPRFIFAESADEIDLLLSVGENEANISGPGGPEILVFTADDNGRYDLNLRNLSDAGGAYTLYLYDAAQAVPGAVHRPNAALAAGESVQLQVESRGSRPVLIFVDPVDQSDISVTVTTDDAQTVSEANYSGPGSAEAAFLLPLETTRYTVTVKEINNAPAQINVLLVPLE